MDVIGGFFAWSGGIAWFLVGVFLLVHGVDERSGSAVGVGALVMMFLAGVSVAALML